GSHLGRLLESIVAQPQCPLSELELLTPSEQQQLESWNQTATPLPADLTLPRLFEVQVERSPEATALVFESSRLSYRELNRRANQLAHQLRRMGVGPESRVGLFLERS